MLWDRAKWYGLDTGDLLIERLWEIMKVLEQYWDRETFSDICASWVQKKHFEGGGVLRNLVTSEFNKLVGEKKEDIHKIVWVVRDLCEVYEDFYARINAGLASSISLRADLYASNFEMPIILDMRKKIAPLTENLISSAIGLQDSQKAVLLDYMQAARGLGMSLDASLANFEIRKIDEVLDIRRDSFVRKYREIFSTIQEASSENKLPLIARLQVIKSDATGELMESYKPTGASFVNIDLAGIPVASSNLDLGYLCNSISKKYRKEFSEQVKGMVEQFRNSIRTENETLFKLVLHFLGTIMSLFFTDWLERRNINEIDGKPVHESMLGKKMRKTLEIVNAGNTRMQKEGIRELETMLWKANEARNFLEHPEKKGKIEVRDILQSLLVVLSTISVFEQC